MKHCLNLKNGHNSQQLLEVINQGIGDSFKRQVDYAYASPVAGHRHPRLAQQHPEVDNQQRQPDQQQPQGRIARTGARPHLMQLPVARLDPEAPPVQLKELMRLDQPQAVDGVGEVLDPASPVTPRAVLADDPYLSRIGLSRAAFEGVARVVATLPIKQTFDPACAAPRGDRDEKAHAAA